MLSTRQSPRPKHHQIIIIGAGPGGVQLAYFLAQAKIDYLVLDRESAAGSFFERFPVHRKLLSVNKIHTGISDPMKNLRWDWNSLISEKMDLRLASFDKAFYPHADALVRYLRDFCDHTDIAVRFDCSVDSINKEEDQFLLGTSQGEYTCDILVMATGMSIEYMPAIPGASLAERYGSHDRSIERCENKDILIVGKGNSAFETADAFLPYAAHIHLVSPQYLRMAWISHFPGHLRQINSPFCETFSLKLQNAVLNGRVESIERSGEKFSVGITYAENNQSVTFTYDRVIMCTGFMFDSSIFAENLKPALMHDNKLPELTSHWESTNIAGLYFCGSLMQSNDYKKSASAFIHGIRYNCLALSRLIQSHLGTCDYPTVNLMLDASLLLDKIYERILVTSSLFHMNDSLCDAYVFDEGNALVTQMQDVPVRMMAEDLDFKSTSRIELRFTFRPPTNPAARAHFSSPPLIHPVLCFFYRGTLTGECHMFEDVYVEWDRKDYGFCFENALTRWVDALAATHQAKSTPDCTSVRL